VGQWRYLTAKEIGSLAALKMRAQRTASPAKRRRKGR